MQSTTQQQAFFNFSIFLLLASVCSYAPTLMAQRQAEIWHFGQGITITFLDGEPALTSPSSMATTEGCVAQSDANGQLLFYTNGGGQIPDSSVNQNPGMIWNRNHEPMYNMQGREGGGFSAIQSAIAFPVPGNPTQHYLFTMEENEFNVGGSVADQPQGRGLSYFIIDQTLNGGLGGLSLADQRVYVPAYEALSATPIRNEEAAGSHWVICLDGNNHEAFLLLPVTANGPGDWALQTVSVPLSGAIKISPNGRYIFNNRYLFAFDPSSGQISPTPLVDLGNINGLTTSFTPDSRYLYTVRTQNSQRQLTRFDLQEADINSSAAILANLGEGFSYQMQLASNGHLYFLEFEQASNNFGLSEIRCPTTFSPSFNRLLISLLTTEMLNYTGLPNYVDAIFEVPEAIADTIQLPPSLRDLCPGSNLSLTARTPGEAYNWSTGDNSRSISLSKPGTYRVTVTGSCFPTIETYVVELLPPPVVDIIPLNLAAACVGDSILFTFQAEPAVMTVLWPDGSADSTYSTPYLPNDSFQLRVGTPCGRQSFTYTFPPEEIFSASLSIDFSPPLCQGAELRLAVSGNLIYTDSLALQNAVVWEDGSQGLSRLVVADSLQQYQAIVSSPCGDTIVLLASSLDYSLCPLDCDAAIPSLFSPNRDGRNDGFRVFSNCRLSDYQLKIFNRWGQIVFSSNNPTAAWDGSKNGVPQPMDIYLYQLQFRFPNQPDLEKRDGQLSLIR